MRTRRAFPIAAMALLVPASPALAEQWWRVPIGGNPGAVSALYAESETVTDSVAGKLVWIIKWFDPGLSPYATLKEQIDFDCRIPRYRGIMRIWTDRAGHITIADAGDQRWNDVMEGTSEHAAQSFACSGPPPGSEKVEAAGE